MTPEEKHLWYDLLKRLPYNVRRQHNIERYIVDFYIAEKKTVIEIDGRQHLLPEHKEADKQRDNDLAGWGITVLRYSNDNVRNMFGAVSIDSTDIVLIKKYIANFDYETGISSIEVGLGADVNGDGKIDAKDVVLLKKYIANYDVETGKSSVTLGPTK